MLEIITLLADSNKMQRTAQEESSISVEEMQGKIRPRYSMGRALSLGHLGSKAGGAHRVQLSMNQRSQTVTVRVSITWKLAHPHSHFSCAALNKQSKGDQSF